MSKRYAEEFRRTVLDLVAAGRPIAQISADLGVSDQTMGKSPGVVGFGSCGWPGRMGPGESLRTHRGDSECTVPE